MFGHDGTPSITNEIDEHCAAFRGDGRRGMRTYKLSWLVDNGYPGALTLELLEEALKSGKCDVTTPAPHGGTAIHAIAMSCTAGSENLEAMKLLLDYHPELINTRSRATETALHFVSMYGDATADRELLRRGADPTLKTYQGNDCFECKRMGGGGEEVKEVIREARDAFKSKCHLPGCDLPGEKRCGGCKRARYCSKEHQTEHWKAATGAHKKLCRSYKALQAEPEVPECRAM